MSSNILSYACRHYHHLGIQAGRPFYIATCPMRIIPKIFSFDENDVPPELRA
ncbi:DNA sulfur modification protein DndB, partial [Escherichia coli]|uniref:DNA sulfur modification protein DndB n=1 Tax=Escherichia coli TaxID=562 RepID=UPI003B42EE36